MSRTKSLLPNLQVWLRIMIILTPERHRMRGHNLGDWGICRDAAERGASCDVEMSLVSELVMSWKREKPPPDAEVREIERRSECRFISGDPSERARERLLPLWAQPKDRCEDLMKLFTQRQVCCVTFLLLFSLLSVSHSRVYAGFWMTLEVVMIRFIYKLLRKGF